MLQQFNKRIGIFINLSIVQVVEKTFKEIYAKYLSEPSEPVSYGSFVALKPFYVRHTTQKDIEMCVCKDHLHGLWSVETLVKCRKKRVITILFADYQSFFDYLSTDCPPGNLTYISRDGTKTDKTICDYIVKKWQGIKDSIKGLHDDVTAFFAL